MGTTAGSGGGGGDGGWGRNTHTSQQGLPSSEEAGVGGGGTVIGVGQPIWVRLGRPQRSLPQHYRPASALQLPRSPCARPKSRRSTSHGRCRWATRFRFSQPASQPSVIAWGTRCRDTVNANWAVSPSLYTSQTSP